MEWLTTYEANRFIKCTCGHYEIRWINSYPEKGFIAIDHKNNVYIGNIFMDLQDAKSEVEEYDNKS